MSLVLISCSNSCKQYFCTSPCSRSFSKICKLWIHNNCSVILFLVVVFFSFFVFLAVFFCGNVKMHSVAMPLMSLWYSLGLTFCHWKFFFHLVKRLMPMHYCHFCAFRKKNPLLIHQFPCSVIFLLNKRVFIPQTYPKIYTYPGITCSS